MRKKASAEVQRLIPFSGWLGVQSKVFGRVDRKNHPLPSPNFPNFQESFAKMLIKRSQGQAFS